MGVSQCVSRDSGVPAARRPALLVRMVVCATNTTDRVTVLQDSWEASAKTVSICSVRFWVSIATSSTVEYLNHAVVEVWTRCRAKTEVSFFSGPSATVLGNSY